MLRYLDLWRLPIPLNEPAAQHSPGWLQLALYCNEKVSPTACASAYKYHPFAGSYLLPSGPVPWVGVDPVIGPSNLWSDATGVVKPIGMVPELNMNVHSVLVHGPVVASDMRSLQHCAPQFGCVHFRKAGLSQMKCVISPDPLGHFKVRIPLEDPRNLSLCNRAEGAEALCLEPKVMSFLACVKGCLPPPQPTPAADVPPSADLATRIETLKDKYGDTTTAAMPSSGAQQSVAAAAAPPPEQSAAPPLEPIVAPVPQPAVAVSPSQPAPTYPTPAVPAAPQPSQGAPKAPESEASAAVVPTTPEPALSVVAPVLIQPKYVGMVSSPPGAKAEAYKAAVAAVCHFTT